MTRARRWRRGFQGDDSVFRIPDRLDDLRVAERLQRRDVEMRDPDAGFAMDQRHEALAREASGEAHHVLLHQPHRDEAFGIGVPESVGLASHGQVPGEDDVVREAAESERGIGPESCSGIRMAYRHETGMPEWVGETCRSKMVKAMPTLAPGLDLKAQQYELFIKQCEDVGLGW